MENVFTMIAEALSYNFIQNALSVGILISLCCSLLGIFIVLNRYSMIGDGLAHVSFASVAIALMLGVLPIAVSIPIVSISSIAILKLNEKADMHGDAALGLVSAFAVSVGIMIASVSQGLNVDIFSYLFGSILLISKLDVTMARILSIIVIGVILLFYGKLFSIAYDEEFSSIMGLKVKRYKYLLSILTSITVVMGIRVVGTMLISSMIIFPTVTALQLTKGFKITIILSCVISVFCVIAGIFISYVLNLPTGASIVMLNGILFILFFILKKVKLLSN